MSIRPHVPIAAYSEFMPSPRFGRLPYGEIGDRPTIDGDPSVWPVNEREELGELRPGLEQVARQVVPRLAHLVRGERSHGISRHDLIENPYWPDELAARAGTLKHERMICFLALALSRTQDDKGRVRWTLFGGSEQGPARPFWRSSFEAPDQDRSPLVATAFLRILLRDAFDEPIDKDAEIRRAGLRILPQGDLPSPLPAWDEGPLPSWAGPLMLEDGDSLRGVRYVLTFRPFGLLPEPIRRRYLYGRLHLLPCPASLIPWGVPYSHRLRAELPLAVQVPLLDLVERRDGIGGFRVPQSGWMHEPRPGEAGPQEGNRLLRPTYTRTHRGARVDRDEPAEPTSREDRIAHVLFGSSEHDLGLYAKPMARNAQIWTADGRLVLDGPLADHSEVRRAASIVAAGGLFGYRFQFPAMRVCDREITWHRPLIAHQPPGSGRPTVLHDGPLGYLTSDRADRPNPAEALESWPRLRLREPYLAAIESFRRPEDPRPQRSSVGCLNLLEARETIGSPLPRSFARRLVPVPDAQSIDEWLDALPRHAEYAERGRRLADELRSALSPEEAISASLTFGHTSRRVFEIRYWKTIAALSGGRFPNRNTADCARDTATRKALVHPRRDLEALGDEILDRHQRAIVASAMYGKAMVGDLPFSWRTECRLDWSDGWLATQGPVPHERDLIVVIPGRDRCRAIIMADHYDTAYMEDRYRRRGVRLAAPGSDDNTSATAALLMAAPVLLEMSREGRLSCDVWLIHLTGEEFPADSLGARHLCDLLISPRCSGGCATGVSSTCRAPGSRACSCSTWSATRIPDTPACSRSRPESGRRPCNWR